MPSDPQMQMNTQTKMKQQTDNKEPHVLVSQLKQRNNHNGFCVQGLRLEKI